MKPCRLLYKMHHKFNFSTKKTELQDLSDCCAGRPLKPSTDSTAPDVRMLQLPPRRSVPP